MTTTHQKDEMTADQLQRSSQCSRCCPDFTRCMMTRSAFLLLPFRAFIIFGCSTTGLGAEAASSAMRCSIRALHTGCALSTGSRWPTTKRLDDRCGWEECTLPCSNEMQTAGLEESLHELRVVAGGTRLPLQHVAGRPLLRRHLRHKVRPHLHHLGACKINSFHGSTP